MLLAFVAQMQILSRQQAVADSLAGVRLQILQTTTTRTTTTNGRSPAQPLLRAAARRACKQRSLMHQQGAHRPIKVQLVVAAVLQASTEKASARHALVLGMYEGAAGLSQVRWAARQNTPCQLAAQQQLGISPGA
jgi:hypothetical protein